MIRISSRRTSKWSELLAVMAEHVEIRGFLLKFLDASLLYRLAWWEAEQRLFVVGAIPTAEKLIMLSS
jgi:hypothetical protein